MSAPLLLGSSHFRWRQVDGDTPDSELAGRSRMARVETGSGLVAGVRKLTCSLWGLAPAWFTAFDGHKGAELSFSRK